MLDHAFQRRREIERMLLSGKRLTVPKLMVIEKVIVYPGDRIEIVWKFEGHSTNSMTLTK